LYDRRVVPVPRILVVDDEPLISDLIENWLTELGCEVVGPAHTVPDGLMLADSGQLDGAILDVNLGKDSFYSIARMLEALGVPIAFATGDGGLDETQGFKNPILLPKPFDFRDVKRALEALLERTADLDQ
jgi:DNA-binding response OmpR family regulator